MTAEPNPLVQDGVYAPMDESTWLRLLQENPENEEVRNDYFAWLVEADDHRAKYVRLMQERLELQDKLDQVEWQIHNFPRVTKDWLEVAFPLRVRSLTVGRVYLRPNPASPPFVSVGKFVTPDTVVCFIEVMLTYNEVTAGVHGVVEEIAVNDGDAVEYNQVLFRFKRLPDPFDF